MIPGVNGFLEAGIEIEELPDKTYKMHMDRRYISGYCQGREAVKQTIYKILSTERYRYIIYSWNYGVEFEDLFGEPISYVCPEIKRRIEDALSCDRRILSCSSFSFGTKEQGVVRVSFTVHTMYGEIAMDTEVRV
ncbi:MAG: DUF2634 domain-containing protein [Clostridiales bacterium]|nr:DUF2634 domain-containing protein [Clostridiales bacterium]